MNLIELAESIGADYSDAGGCYMLYTEELQAFADAITKEKDAEIESLKISEACSRQEVANAAKKIEQLNSALDAKITICGDERIHELKAKVAMLRDYLDDIIRTGWVYDSDAIKQALTATEQDVTRWVNQVKADALEEVEESTWFSEKHQYDVISRDEVTKMMKQLRGEQV